MNLVNFFSQSVSFTDQLLRLFVFLDFKDVRTRSEWRTKLFSDKIVPWGVSKGVTRSIGGRNEVVLISIDKVGKEFQTNIKLQRQILIQNSLIMVLAAIDKLLHQAIISTKFAQRLKSGKFDSLVKKFPPSEAYEIAMQATKRKGHGGKRVPRPAVKIRDAVSTRLYEMPFLGTIQLEEVCNICGLKDVFKNFTKQLGLKDAKLQRDRWSSIYKKRNQFVHECNIMRQKISSKIKYNAVDINTLLDDIDFSKKFGHFLAQNLTN